MEENVGHQPQMILRTKNGLTSIYDVVSSSEDKNYTINPKASLILSDKVKQIPDSLFYACSPNGKHVFVQQKQRGLLKLDLDSTEQHYQSFLKDSTAVQYAAFSPKGT